MIFDAIRAISILLEGPLIIGAIADIAQ